jgi:hypothetical protein
MLGFDLDTRSLGAYRSTAESAAGSACALKSDPSKDEGINIVYPKSERHLLTVANTQQHKPNQNCQSTVDQMRLASTLINHANLSNSRRTKRRSMRK